MQIKMLLIDMYLIQVLGMVGTTQGVNCGQKTMQL